MARRRPIRPYWHSRSRICQGSWLSLPCNVSMAEDLSAALYSSRPVGKRITRQSLKSKVYATCAPFAPINWRSMTLMPRGVL
jgi:hypothetical protein